MIQALQVPTPEEASRIARLLQEEGLARTPPGPSVGDWLRAVGAGVREWLSELAPWGGSLATLVGEVLLWAVVGAGVLTLAWLLVMALRRAPARLADHRSEGQSGASAALARESRSASDWRSILERRLRTGDAAGAVEALWWYLLLSVGGGRTSREITGRALVRRAGRDDLLPMVNRLEAMTYGRLSPPLDQIRALAGQVDGALVGSLSR